MEELSPVSKKLNILYNEKLANGSLSIQQLFLQDPNRVTNYTKHLQCTGQGDKGQINLDIYYDYSKNLIDHDIMNALIDFADQSGLSQFIEQLFSGAPLNATEGRPVLHMALRAQPQAFYSTLKQPKFFNYEMEMPSVFANVQEELERMRQLSHDIVMGSWFGYSGKRIRDFVNIGIGGSDLGPRMVARAFEGVYPSEGRRCHFVSNVDAMDLASVLVQCHPETTLFIIVSKTFTTQETMMNAASAKAWFLAHSGGDESAVKQHFVAVSTNKAAVTAFGLPDDGQHIFTMWDFVGGRYSIWGTVGLSICLTYGFDVFSQLLAGAALMDAHFYENSSNGKWRQNLPVILALLGHWYNTVCEWETLAILPYEAGLVHLPSYLQQLDMESNGKRALRADFLQKFKSSLTTNAQDTSTNKSLENNGASPETKNLLASWQTGQIVWGSVGTNGQHAFYQLLHQGTKHVQIEFLGARRPTKHHAIHSVLDYTRHHKVLLANMIAQSEALLKGTPLPEALLNGSPLPDSSKDLSSLSKSTSRYFEGNKPSSILLYDCLDAVHLGALIALYEHKVAVQGHLWGIYSFDQWGVELGKQLATNILNEKVDNSIKEGTLDSKKPSHDPSTEALLSLLGLSS